MLAVIGDRKETPWDATRGLRALFGGLLVAVFLGAELICDNARVLPRRYSGSLYYADSLHYFLEVGTQSSNQARYCRADL